MRKTNSVGLHTVWVHLYNIFKMSKLQRRIQISGCWGLGMGKGAEGRWGGYKMATWGIPMVMKLFWIFTVVVHTLNSICDNICIELPTPTHIHTSISKTREIWTRSVDCFNINILGMVLSCSYVRCYHWGKLSKGYSGSLCIISYIYMWIWSFSNNVLLLFPFFPFSFLFC